MNGKTLARKLLMKVGHAVGFIYGLFFGITCVVLHKEDSLRSFIRRMS